MSAKGFIVSVGMIFMCAGMQAQTIKNAQADSLWNNFSFRNNIASYSLMGAGLGIHFFAHDTFDLFVKESVQGYYEKNNLRTYDFDDKLQYVPISMDLALGMVGVNAENGFVDRFVEAATAYVLLGITSGIAKEAFHTLRPNGGDYKSFPSGHTDFSFCGAELVRLEYGWGWGGLAYAMATAVGAQRIIKNRHWASDVIMGAGLGILCADAGRYLLDPAKKLLHLEGHDDVKLVLSPRVDSVSGGMMASFALVF